MTDTTPMAPTDAELWQLYMQMPRQHKDPIGFARAVLTRWGQPAQAAEPVAWAFKYDDGTWHDPSTTEHSSGMRPLFEAPHPVAGEHVGWMWQHDETGRTGFVDCWQVENGWQEGNPRLRLISKLYATPQPTQAVNQADRPFIVRLAEDFAEECVTAGYVTTKAASYGRLMNEALSTQPQAGAVPLTDEQIEALPMWKRFVGLWPETRREIVRIIESAHGIGIKGGQHGTEY